MPSSACNHDRVGVPQHAGAALGPSLQPWQADQTCLGMPNWHKASLGQEAYIISVQDMLLREITLRTNMEACNRLPVLDGPGPLCKRRLLVKSGAIRMQP